MKIKLIADSSANSCGNVTMDISYVPLKIVTSEKEYVDTPELDVSQMLRELKAYKGKSHTSCPSVQDWFEAFDERDMIFGVSLTSNLSGCYNSSIIASQKYQEQRPDAKIFIMDSLSAGPELELILEKYQLLIGEGKSFEDICGEINNYGKHTHLVFSLESLDNFAKNGRVSPVIAKAAGLLGLRIVGKASDTGYLEPLHKCRGEKKALVQMLNTMKEMGYRGGKVRISHTFNSNAAEELAAMIRSEFPGSDISITCNRGLCCYYAEEGAVLVGFEDT